MASHIEQDLKMSKTNRDSALYLKRSNNVLIGILGKYVDDSFQAGTDDFLNSTYILLKTFVSRERNFNTFNYSISPILTQKGDIFLNQTSYIFSLRLLEAKSSLSNLISARSNFSCMTHNRPDVRAAVVFYHKLLINFFHKTC